jgi:hypothetical protein
MYKNPLNNGDISDNNSLKKQRDYGKRIKKYESIKLKTEPTELQKYYQYQTYQQPILDELNYVAERMKKEDIKKKTEDYKFIEELKIKREGLMKETSKKEGEDIAREELFDKSSLIKNEDMTPAINTDIEMVYPKEPTKEQINIIRNEMFDNQEQIIPNLVPFQEEIFELSRGKNKKNMAATTIQNAFKNNDETMTETTEISQRETQPEKTKKAKKGKLGNKTK